MDWIDEEKRRRANGIKTPLLQSAHAEVNSRYPGCTLEYCDNCGDPTGRAGKGDDSLYTDEDEGPYCWECWQLMEQESLTNDPTPTIPDRSR